MVRTDAAPPVQPVPGRGRVQPTDCPYHLDDYGGGCGLCYILFMRWDGDKSKSIAPCGVSMDTLTKRNII